MKTTVKEVLEKVQRYAEVREKVTSLQIQLNDVEQRKPWKVKEMTIQLEELTALAKRLGEERL